MEKETKQQDVDINEFKKSVDNFSDVTNQMLEVCTALVAKALPIEYGVWFKRYSILLTIRILIQVDKIVEAVKLYDEFNNILSLTEEEEKEFQETINK